MPNNVSKWRGAGVVGIGTRMAIGLSMATPACAASWSQAQSWMSPEDWPTYLLSGSLALLVIGIALKAVKVLRPADREARPAEPGPDHSIGALRNNVLRQFLWGDR